jgi:ActR/RegA family two-component response regulator
MQNKARILVVDDELPVCRSVARALGAEYEVDTALSAEEAIEKQNGTGYDLIVTDLMMPGLSGMDLLQHLSEAGSSTKVVMITGYPSVKTAVMSIKLGAFDYIPKPFTPGEIRNMVSRALASGGAPAEAGRKRGPATAPPQGLYSITDNSWAALEESGDVRVGVHSAFINAIEDPVSVEMPKVGEMRYQGEVCLRITDSRGNVHRVWTPVSGKVKTINEGIARDISGLVRDPYGEGWART